MFVLLVAALVGGAWYGRYRIVDTFPTAARLYDLVGASISPVAPGLDIDDVATSWRLRNGNRFLVVEGQITNRAGATQPVPALEVKLSDSLGTGLNSWRTTAEEAALAPGDTTRFTTRRRAHSDDTREVTIKFIRPGS
jgi:hypothetical protein